MRTCLSILAVLAFAIQSSAQETNALVLPKAANTTPQKIGAAAATNYYDQLMIVTGRVAQVTIRPTVTFLNLDKPFPDSPFTVVIFHGHSNFYGDANALRGKSIEIKGKIRNYRDKPEIVLDNTNQLTVLGMPGLTNAPVVLPPANPPPPATPATNFPEIM